MIKLVTMKDGYSVAVISNDDHAGRWIQELGRLDYDRGVDAILPYLKKGDTVIDVGALIGGFTSPMAKAVGPSGSVLAFEPNLDAFVCLSVNCRDLPQVKLFNEALSSHDGMVTIEREDNAGASHIFPCSAAGVTPIRPLDSLQLDGCDFIKMDVEGFEPNAIEGAIQTIIKFKPVIFIELNDGALKRYGFEKADVLLPLFELGYHLKFLHPSHNLQLTQLDVILTPQK